jgi:tetratricopeptide (TPR) repeat protein
MKRALAALLLVALAIVGGSLAYQSVNREAEYRALLSRGDAALRASDTFGAVEAYSGAIALRPDSMLPHLRRGESYRQRNEFDAAARDFRLASNLDPAAMRPLEALGDVEYQRQWFNRAAEVYEARLQLDERSPLVWYKLALARYRAGDLDAALTALTQALQLKPDLTDAQYLRGVCLRELGRPTEALHVFEQVVALSPGLISAREEIADLHGALGRRADELEQLQVIAGLDRGHVERQVRVSLAHARAGHGEVAVLTLGSALERSPNEPLIYAALGRVWLNMADTRADALSNALEALERAASMPGASSEVLTLYGRALVKAGQNAAAERILQQATGRFPVDPDAFLPYADVAERQGHHDAARTALLEYGALVQNEATFASRAARIGRLSLRLNQPVVAAVWLERASVANSADVRILALLVDAQLRAGNREKAQATLARALDKEPNNPTLLDLIRRAR